jgi:hypothetical protein
VTITMPEATSGKALAKWRRAQAVQLALSGVSYDQIAEQVGYANRGTAWRAVNEALNANVVEGVENYRTVELARLDALLLAHWPGAVSGIDYKSAEIAMKVIAQRSKLLGLENIPPVEERPKTIIVRRDHYVEDLKAIVGEGNQGSNAWASDTKMKSRSG